MNGLSAAEPARQLPSNIEAEQALLGAILVNNRAYGVVAETLRPEHFWHGVHGRIYAAIGKLIDGGVVADPVALKNAFEQDGGLPAIGGAQYLAQLLQSAVTVINSANYAALLVDLAKRRELIGACYNALDDAYTVDLDRPIDTIVGEHEAALYDIAGLAGNGVGAAPLATALRESIALTEAAYKTGGKTPGVETGLLDLDLLIGGLGRGNLEIIAGRPSMGKSSLAAGIALAAAERGVPTLIFSLEETRAQQAQRFLGSWSGIAPNLQRRGTLEASAWGRLSDAEAALSALPVTIDDTAALSLGELRRRSRTLKRTAGIGLIIVDHLQLVTVPGKNDRRIEVGIITRGLKQLAKELELPVVCLSQLSRAVEQRDSKRPVLSDLRECVIGSTRVIDAENGHWISVDTLQPGQTIFGLSKDQKILPFRVRDVWPTGIKPTFRITTKTGRHISATANHPFLTADGWDNLESLAPGELIATAMRLPAHGTQNDLPDLSRLMGYLIGDGTYKKHREVGFISSDPETFGDVVNIVSSRFPSVTVSMKADRGPWQDAAFVCKNENGFGKPYGNPLREWLRSIGAHGQSDKTKRAPDFVFENDGNASEFIAGYLAADGCVKHSRKGDRPSVWEIHFDTVSRGLAEDIQAILLRLGIVSSVDNGRMSNKATIPLYRINVSPHHDNIKRFAGRIPVVGEKRILLNAILSEPVANLTNPGVFALPSSVSSMLAGLAPRRTLGTRSGPKTHLGWTDLGKRMRRDVCLKWATELSSDEMAMWASSDVLWEEIESIEPAEHAEVYDICVPGCGNFIANGIVAHNSGDIEADADGVFFLYRAEYYLDREEPARRPNESDEKFNDRQDRWKEACEQAYGLAEIVVAKRRNGPIGTIKVRWDSALTKFDNLAR